MRKKTYKDLYNELEDSYKLNNDLDLFKKRYYELKKSFTIQERWNEINYFFDFLIYNGKISDALVEWKFLREEEWEGWNKGFTYRDSEIYTLMKFERLLNESIIDGNFIEKIAPKDSQLTAFGKRNITSIHKVITKIIKTSCEESFFGKFYKNYTLNSKSRITFPLEYYAKFFNHNSNYEKQWKWYTESTEGIKLGRARMKNGKASASIALLAIRSEASRLLREAENNYRISIGARKIGEEWISETELYYKIKNHFESLEVIQHGKPKWLGRQHFDIWIPELKIAIEYQGQQHDKAIDYFGGEKAFKQNKKRDLVKKVKSKANGVALIEVRPNYDFEEVVIKINSNASN